ncbi:MAG: bis(5'-nucleosyl)-tetraphosphatase (symmetrical) YqeK [Thermosediminibacteraceae bacterium]|nr:bis(5'-nucleosyl)-tetraphosphatase (symmetrical) YqeK [Thermosediminibacteraceae bacterium]
MISKKFILEDLKKNLTEERFLHTLGVMETAVTLAQRYGVDEEKAELAAMVHDCAKDIPVAEQLNLVREFGILLDEISRLEKALIHAPLGAVLARKRYGIEDPGILRAVCVHTTGDENMTTLDKVVFLADYIEPGRNFPGVEKLRKVALEDLDEAVIMACNSTIKYVLEQGKLLHPRMVQARNSLLLEKLKRGEVNGKSN